MLIFSGFMGMWALLLGNSRCTAESLSTETASYKEPKPGEFMKNWLICGPFPVFERGAIPEGEEVQKRAFASDFLTQHGGETKIRPTPGLTHQRDGEEYQAESLSYPAV